MTRIKLMRQQMGLSQSELARRSGVHSSTISLIESGRMAPYGTQLTKIAAALDVAPEDARTLLDQIELPTAETATANLNRK